MLPKNINETQLNDAIQSLWMLGFAMQNTTLKLSTTEPFEPFDYNSDFGAIHIVRAEDAETNA